MPIKRQRENILKAPLPRLLCLPALHPPPPPVLFSFLSSISSSPLPVCSRTLLLTAADCRRRRREMSSDCELAWSGKLGPRCDKCCPARQCHHGDGVVSGCWAPKREKPSACYLTGDWKSVRMSLITGKMKSQIKQISDIPKRISHDVVNLLLN